MLTVDFITQAISSVFQLPHFHFEAENFAYCPGQRRQHDHFGQAVENGVLGQPEDAIGRLIDEAICRRQRVVDSLQGLLLFRFPLHLRFKLIKFKHCSKNIMGEVKAV